MTVTVDTEMAEAAGAATTPSAAVTSAAAATSEMATTEHAQQFFTERLWKAVRGGDVERTVRALERLDDGVRRSLLPELKELRAEYRREEGWSDNWRERRLALLFAGAGCQTGAAAAATWLAARDLRRWSRALPHEHVVRVLRHRDPGWLGDVAHRLAARPTTAAEDYEVIRALAERSGGPMPATDGFVEGWAWAKSVWNQNRTDESLLDRLRADPITPDLAPRLLSDVEIGGRVMAWSMEDHPAAWTGAIPRLCAEGLLKRADVLDTCIATLLRGGRPAALRPFLYLVTYLRPTPEESAAHLDDWAALAADAPSTVAGYAQERLAELLADGGLSAERLADVSAGVLFRTEKKLVRAQLQLIDRAIKSRREDAGVLLPAAAEAFGHGDDGLRERAVKLVRRHLPKADAAAHERIAEAAGALTRTQQAVLADALRVPVAPDPAGDTAGPEEELLPPPPVPEPLGPAPVEPAAIAGEIAVLLAGQGTFLDHERGLDALVRAAHRDRAGLKEALGSLPARHSWWYAEDEYRLQYYGIGLVVDAVLGELDLELLRRGRESLTKAGEKHVYGAFERLHTARLVEAAWGIAMDRPLPHLLATPNTSDGSIEVATLLDRLRGYARAGMEPEPVDLGLALLRVRVPGAAGADASGSGATGSDSAGSDIAASVTVASATATSASHIAAARELGAAGERLADWLAAGGLPARTLERRVGRLPEGRREWWYASRKVEELLRMVVGESEVLRRDFPQPLAGMGRGYDPYAQPMRWYERSARRGAITVFPHDPEAVAAFWLPAVAAGAEEDTRGAAERLPQLAEAPGRPGPAVHLAIAFGLCARHPQDRLAATDALLTLAARGNLDATRLGTDLAELVLLGAGKLTRLADATRTAAQTGAWRTIHAVLTAALPPLLTTDQRPHALGALLAVAADCAERVGTARPLPGLDHLPTGTGSQLARQADRLRAVVTAAEATA
ncbi:hypothetical protein G5C51_39490 [Streptomyces sp. A7024]|uniref:Secreted protein n=1 Tax=Streptomyces coryli TaxID=1128680 RepID=A0A6G4UE12_9ACTN|nr:DUF6493 family protein [Streptomyces coryli]NGN69960.1 hypothetical protein [Streptomyces coryli]